jgi:catechol 2,3-dioxygenase-like lactoylglutathione lyase family enzyme
VIALHRLDHFALRVADLAEATTRWSLQFGLTVRSSDAEHAVLTCDDEPRALELLAAESGIGAGFARVGWELARDCSLDDAAAHLEATGTPYTRHDGHLDLADLEGNPQRLLAYTPPASRLVAHARPAGALPVGHPRKLGHVNFLTARIEEQRHFYCDVLGMRLTDWLGDGGVWLHINSDHHVMALVQTRNPPAYRHFHHLALDVVDIGQMRVALDHLGRHGRWLGWGPTRHGVGGNIASYVRIVEEHCFVELYCDMEQLAADHEPREWPDDRYSSNTWGPLPPRSYFRFDDAAVESERESLEMQGTPLPEAVAT